MREDCTFGSVRGAPGNRRPYRRPSLAPKQFPQHLPPQGLQYTIRPRRRMSGVIRIQGQNRKLWFDFSPGEADSHSKSQVIRLGMIRNRGALICQESRG
jgi:hypothetical protein